VVFRRVLKMRRFKTSSLMVGGALVFALACSFPGLATAQGGQVKALTFDVYGTLISWEAVEKAVADLFQKKGIGADPKAFNLLWRSKQLQYTMLNTMIGKGFEPLILLTRKALRTAAAFQGVPLTKEEEERLAQVWIREVEPYPDVVEGLKALKKLGYLMTPLTNGDSEMVRIGVVEGLAKRGFQFDTSLTADLWGVYKPHPEIYLKSIAKLGLKPEEVIHVCRAQFDIFGAKAAGLKVAWINRGREPLEAYGFQPDWIANDLLELAEILERERP
jgi:2-haloacid dehalogenase